MKSQFNTDEDYLNCIYKKINVKLDDYLSNETGSIITLHKEYRMVEI